MSKGIRLSKKHGLNPTIPKCYFCLEDKNMVILAGQLRNDEKAPQDMVWDMEPCDTCKQYMAQGIILISVSEEKTTDRKNPYRTGGWVVVTEDAIKRMLEDTPMREQTLTKRVAFISDEVWDLMGLPRGPLDKITEPTGGTP